MAYDGRSGPHRLWVSANNVMCGAFLRSSDDFGGIWTNPLEASIRFPRESGASLRNIWQICLGRNDEPEKLYCGVEPAARAIRRVLPERVAFGMLPAALFALLPTCP